MVSDGNEGLERSAILKLSLEEEILEWVASPGPSTLGGILKEYLR